MISVIVAAGFVTNLKTRITLCELCQAARGITNNGEIVNQMMDDWADIDVSAICEQVLWMTGVNCSRESVIFRKYELKFSDMKFILFTLFFLVICKFQFAVNSMTF